MTPRLIVPAILSAVMLSTPVLAAGSYSVVTPAPHTQTAAAMTPADKCTAFQKQFDEAATTHAKAAKFAEAKTLRSEGGDLCIAGKQAEGAAKLEKAIKDLGLKPKA